jgi:putative hydrolase of the HAD superfamily
MKKAVYFDFYRTLVDISTDEDDPWVYTTLSRYLSYHSVVIAPEELERAYFEEVQQHLNQSTEKYPEIDVYDIFSNIMHKYGKKRYAYSIIIDTALLFRSLTVRHLEFFERVFDVLGFVNKKYETGVISDAQWVFAEPEMAMLGLNQFFKITILSSRFGFRKPDMRLFSLAMQKLGVGPKESVYVGDNPSTDLVGAKIAGMKFVLFGSECKSYNGFQPDRCFHDYSELVNILETIWK